MKVGDKVVVMDPGLLMLQHLIPGNKKNNVGKVVEINYMGEKGTILVEFPLSGKNHSQVAPYPQSMVVPYKRKNT